MKAVISLDFLFFSEIHYYDRQCDFIWCNATVYLELFVSKIHK